MRRRLSLVTVGRNTTHETPIERRKEEKKKGNWSVGKCATPKERGEKMEKMAKTRPKGVQSCNFTD